MALGSVQNRVRTACSYTYFLSGFRWSSMAIGGCSSYYFISTLHISASYQFNQAKGGGFHLGFESHGVLNCHISSPIDTDLGIYHAQSLTSSSRRSQTWRRFSWSLIVSVSNVWFSTHPGAVKLHLILR
ncbi:hypothetical protein Bca4012_101243 [Brassica carinata]|uniref:Uncharacterized protein n=1 Tax=Brassica carinata TaxID=52824 RepID=A0A8X7PL70_BRACI|nr:hypothetical protein Bca52824_083671 [Brassica carinata]